MNRYPAWKNGLLLCCVLLGLLYTVPNFFGESPALHISPLNSTTRVDATLLKQIETHLSAEHLAYTGLYWDERGIKVRFADTDIQLRAKDSLQKILGGDYTVALNLLSRTPNWLLALGAKPMYLGLDLRGGVHFLMQVDMPAALSKSLDSLLIDIKNNLRKERILYLGLIRNGQRLELRFSDVASLKLALGVLSKNFANLQFQTTNSGSEAVLYASLSLPEQAQIKELALKQNIQTLHNRINELGVAEPIIQQQGQDRVVVQLPGVQDTAKAKEILGRTATLEIKLVDEEKADVVTLKGDQVPLGDELQHDRDGHPLLLKKTVLLTGDYITDAGPGVNSQTGQSVVNVTLNSKGARLFQQITREHVGKRLAILLVEKGIAEVVTAPHINEEISGGRVQITGMASPQEATDIALLLRAGALAAPMEIVEERTVGPSMGQDNINRGIHSTLWGFAVIAVMMSLYYLIFGVVSVVALAINLLLLVAILSLLQATLTLPGLAAIALALGMAIDANVLINERVREELRLGNTPQSSIQMGYERAFGTILDSNVTTLIAGLALFMFGTGPIKGFAVVHVLGILTSMFSAVLISRALVNWIYGGRRKLTGLTIG